MEESKTTETTSEAITEKPKSKTGCVIVVMGRQGAGKTPTVKELMQKANMKNNVVYDPRREYSLEDCTIFHSAETFKEFIKGVKDSFIIVEEATGFISSFKDVELTEFVIAVEHNRNIICFLFHSILDAPQYLLRLSRIHVLLKTNDDPKEVKQSRNRLYQYLGIPRDRHPVFIDNYEN